MAPPLNDDAVFEAALKVRKMIEDLMREILEKEIRFVKKSIRLGIMPRNHHLK
jgi:hypothetical protein